MAEFRHFCNVLERSDENKWCPIDDKDGHSNCWVISIDLP
jgi:hypothetical protein